MSAYFSLEECTSNIRLYNQGSCFKTVDGYDNFDFCRIIVHQDIRLQVKRFRTEENYDFLVVNNVQYSGTWGPEQVLVAAGGRILFSSDYLITDEGFAICGAAQTSSGTNSSIAISVTPLTLGILSCVCVVCVILLWQKLRRAKIQDMQGNLQRRHRGEDLVIASLSEKPGVGIMTQVEQSVEGAVDDRRRPQNRANRDMPSDYSMSFNLWPQFTSSGTNSPVHIESKQIMLADLEEEKDISRSFTGLIHEDVDSSELAPPDGSESPPSYLLAEELMQLEGEEGKKDY